MVKWMFKFSSLSRDPFILILSSQVWSENADGSGAYNFHTGMGGYLQSLVFGYAGLDLSFEALTLDPQLSGAWTEMTLRGVDYLRSSFDVGVNATFMTVNRTSGDVNTPIDLVLTKGRGLTTRIPLKVGQAVSVEKQRAFIQKTS